MLYKAILAGSKAFHDLENRGKHYDCYFQCQRVHVWHQPDLLELTDVEHLINFLN